MQLRIRNHLTAVSVAIITLPFVTTTVTSAEPAKTPPGEMVADLAPANSETEGDDVSASGQDSEFDTEWESCLTQAATGNIACFEDNGDKFRVYDGNADGASAVAFWWTSYGPSGTCYNSNGAGTWRTCNYDWVEGATVYWQTCYHNVSAGGGMQCSGHVLSRRI